MIQARCFCTKHGKLDFENILIKNGVPICAICSSELEFGTVRPRFDVNKSLKKKKKR